MSFFDMLLAQKLSGNGGGGGSVLDYSTTEQDTGVKWIDGKKIYMISFDCHESPISTNNGTIADVSSLHIGNLVGAEMTAINNSEKLPQGAAGRCVYINSDALKFYNGNSGGSLTYCTIWYTKSSS